MEECNVCYEPYNGSRNKIPCEYEGTCAFNACKKCVRTFLLSTTNDPCCMTCNKAWSDAFLVRHLNASFVHTEYRIHRKELLTQQEISRLPTTMAAAETYKQVKALETQIEALEVENKAAQKILNQKDNMRINATKRCAGYNSYPTSIEQIDMKWTPEDITAAYIKLHVLEKVKNRSCGIHHIKPPLKARYLELTGTALVFTDAEASAVFKKMVRLEAEKDNTTKECKVAAADKKLIVNAIRKLQHDIRVVKNGGNVAGIPAKEVREFIMPCSNEGCRGFLSTQYKCGICEHYTCAKCFDLIGLSKTTTEHVCKPENVESADLIRKQTKPCPCCGTRISKIDGCDQMWCTQCHKAFSWNTGKIVTGVIHNPHFYQYQRENGGVAPRNPGDVPCGGLPYLQVIQQVLRRKMPAELMQAPPVLVLLEIHRLQHHFDQEYIRSLRRKVAADQDNEKERVLFIVNEITRKELAARVMRKDNARKKNTAILYVCDLFTSVAIDLFRGIVMSEAVGIPFMKEIVRLSAEYETLRQYCMEQFKNISLTYGVCVPSISAEWVFSTTKFNAKGDVDKYVERREEQKKQRQTKQAEHRELERLAWTLRRQAMINAAPAAPAAVVVE